MAKLMELMADYGAWPLWVYSDGDLEDTPDPADLPVNDELKAALVNWAKCYDATFNDDNPSDSGFASPAEEAFEAEGRRLWQELQAQLGLNWKVTYYS